MITDANGKCAFEIRDSTGKEFKKIYDADGNLLFKNWNTIQGTPPIVFKGYNRSLKNYKIYGNTIQDGTPTPETPVEVQGCGVRTENLFNEVYPNIRADVPEYRSIFVGDGEFTLSTSADRCKNAANLFFLAGGVKSGAATVTNGVWKENPRTITSLNGYVTIAYRYYDEEESDPRFNTAMLNTGSTALPYEPYGYKLPVTISNGVFLDEPLRGIGEYKDTLDLSTGVVVRRIKKLILTGKGNENWSGTAKFRMGLSGQIATIAPICTHYRGATTASYVDLADGRVTVNGGIGLTLSIYDSVNQSSLTAWKSYLATQYEAGTPVTVWYVLAEPETETVSVPSGLSGIIEGYCIQDGTPTPENPIEVVSNGTVQSDGTYLVPRTAQSITTPVYVGSEPLHKISDYADYIDFERGVVVRNIKKLVLTGEEDWAATGSSGHSWRAIVYGMLRPSSTGVKAKILSTHYKTITFNESYAGNVTGIGVPASTYWIDICDTNIYSLNNFKTYLQQQYAAGTPVTVWYVLAKPEETPLSDLNPITPLKGINTLSTNTTIHPSEMYIKGKIKSLATHMLVDSSGNILLTSNNYQLVTKEE